MHIAIDCRAWDWTGVGRYIRNLVFEYYKNPHGHRFTLLVPKGEEERIRKQIESSMDSRMRGNDNTFDYVGVEPSYYSWREQTLFLYQLNKLQNIDLVHFPHFNVPVLYNEPYVVTIHDITRFIFSGQKRQSLLAQLGYEYVFAHAVTHAKKIIAVSNTTKRDMQLLPIMTKNIDVMYEGIDQKFFNTVTQDERKKVRTFLQTNAPYIVFVGVWMSHKNIFRLIDAFAEVQKKYPAFKLIITGKYQPGYSDLVGYVKHKQVANSVLFPGFVPDTLLPALYAESALMAFPSLYEGYGLPPLEAQACRTAVLSSNVSSMPELLGNSAEYVNPESIHDIARGMFAVIQDETYANLLRERGSLNVEKFTTQNTALQHIRAYESALQ